MRLSSLLICILLIGCAEPKLDDRLIGAYADILLFRQSFTTADSTRLRAGIDSVLSFHELTRSEFENRITAFADRPADFRKFNELVQERISAGGKTHQGGGIPSLEKSNDNE